jgi:glycosyltransferase involved in cell wall biosynthesis
MDDVTVLIPVGPKPGNIRWINDALESVYAQTHPVKEIFLIDDQAHLTSQWIWKTFDIYPDNGFHFLNSDHRLKDTWAWDNPPDNRETYISLWQTPWRLGFSAAFNCGMALSMNDLVIYLASDDTLHPDCVADCLETYHQNQEEDAWYALTYQSDSGGICDIPINAAMVTHGLWKFTGGFPPSAFAGPDALLLSCLMAHAPYKIIKVNPGKPNYFIREHEDQDTHSMASFFLEEMGTIRNKETSRFVPNPDWAQHGR